MKKIQFPVLQTVEVGIGFKTADDFRNALTASNCRIDRYSNSMFDDPRFTASVTKTSVGLCWATVKELRFEKATRYDKICARIVEFGYDLCGPWDGPLLRLQYSKQPLDEWLWMAMNPLRNLHGHLNIFDVGHGVDGLWLISLYGDPGILFNPEGRFVFRLRK